MPHRERSAADRPRTPAARRDRDVFENHPRRTRAAAPARMGSEDNHEPARRLTAMAAEQQSIKAPPAAHIAITTNPVSAVVPIGIMTRIGIVARATIFG